MKNVFIAKDGTVFNTRAECHAYELKNNPECREMLELAQKMKDFCGQWDCCQDCPFGFIEGELSLGKSGCLFSEKMPSDFFLRGVDKYIEKTEKKFERKF